MKRALPLARSRAVARWPTVSSTLWRRDGITGKHLMSSSSSSAARDPVRYLTSALRLYSSPPSSPTPPSSSTSPASNGTTSSSRGENGKVSMYYDGMCPVCVREIKHYEKLNERTGHAIRFRDINEDEVKKELSIKGIAFDDAMARMHVETRDGRMVEGIDGFVQVWRELPYWRHLVPLTEIPAISWLMRRAYDAFARNRLWLTGRQRDQ